MSSTENEALVNQRREEILLAALDCFGEKGFVAAKMKDVAARIGMSVGNLYNYFKNKDDIVETLAQREVDRLIKKIECTNRDDTNQQIAELAAIAMSRLTFRNAVFALDIMNASTSNERLLKVLQRYDRVRREALLSMYKQMGINNPEVKLEMDMCLLDGLVIRSVVDPTLNAPRLAESAARQIVLGRTV